MGIPLFFNWFRDKHSSAFLKPDADIATDCLHVDFNALIHMSSHPPGEKIFCKEKMFELLGQNIDELVVCFKPKKALYLATDGVTPRAKLNELQRRRIERIKEKNEENALLTTSGLGPSCFDINSITAGTVFMKEIKDFVCGFIEKKKSEKNDLYNRLEIIYSDDSVAGEGEHKILSFIRLSGTDNKHTIYSWDSDVICLSLTLHTYDIHVIRPTQRYMRNIKEGNYHHRANKDKTGGKTNASVIPKRDDLYYISITKFRNCLRERLECVQKEDQHFHDMINDFIFVSLFLGNDFLPKLPMAIPDKHKDVIEYLLDMIITISKKGGHLTTKEGFNLAILQEYIRELCVTDVKKPYSIKTFTYLNQKRKISIEKINPLVNEDRKKYYENKFSATKTDKIVEICKHYVRSIAWVYDYYQGKLDDWSFFYKYDSAPLPEDLLAVELVEIGFTQTHPDSTLLQLTLITPTESLTLLPSVLKNKISEAKLEEAGRDNEEISKPLGSNTSIETSCFSTNIKQREQIYMKNVEILSEDEKKRNLPGKENLFLDQTQVDKLKQKEKNRREYYGVLSYKIIESPVGTNPNIITDTNEQKKKTNSFLIQEKAKITEIERNKGKK
ncbi:5'-3' exoribonuclease 4 [Cucumispora dikerogammari]|nr:5'-3' exoribonuclease 4 [Cucumispora dikerogammari]